MGLYEGLKDLAKVVQQADNIELYSKLLDLSAQALDLQAEIVKLKQENEELREKRVLNSQIERHEDAYITLKDDKQKIVYCSVCWDREKKLIQGQKNDNGRCFCGNCKNYYYYDKNQYDQMQEHYLDALGNINGVF